MLLAIVPRGPRLTQPVQNTLSKTCPFLCFNGPASSARASSERRTTSCLSPVSDVLFGVTFEWWGSKLLSMGAKEKPTDSSSRSTSLRTTGGCEGSTTARSSSELSVEDAARSSFVRFRSKPLASPNSASSDVAVGLTLNAAPWHRNLSCSTFFFCTPVSPPSLSHFRQFSAICSNSFSCRCFILVVSSVFRLPSLARLRSKSAGSSMVKNSSSNASSSRISFVPN
mmetsp:Transcript_17552/g.43810  ORF Transcript_17552/g.43810 Transcript_17552/m.43810 type:complete len:226 (-) Transcript_17552:1363-2040(-)